MKAQDLIELLPADDKTVSEALRRFEVAAPVLCREPGYCKQLVDEGFMESSVITYHGRPAFVVAWRVTSDAGFWLDIAQTLGAGAPFEMLVQAIEQFARQKNCRYIRFLTIRRGLVSLGQHHGYTPEAVMLTKVL